MSEALIKIHELNIILRDIKLENMMVVEQMKPSTIDTETGEYEDNIFSEGNIVLIDFGLAKQFECSKDTCQLVGSRLEVCDSFMYTYAYMITGFKLCRWVRSCTVWFFLLCHLVF